MIMNLAVADEPYASGLYVAYIDGPIDIRADRKLLMWHHDQWTYPGSDQKYRGHVYGCIGPLPIMELTDGH